MTELEQFQELKDKVLLKYQEQYPFFQGTWKTFSSQDIQNLIGLIEVQCKQTISEKWIYTHLKPETNSKIPRKDMLNILSQFVGYSGWDEFTFEEKVSLSKDSKEVTKSKTKFWFALLLLIFGIAIAFIYFNKKEAPKPKAIELNNEFTNEKVNSNEVKVYEVNDSVSKPLEVKEGKVQVSNEDKKTKLVIKSPFYKTKTVDLNANGEVSESKKIDLKPDDYAMMLKAFMASDIKDWKTRKEQLDKILSDNLEVMVMLKDNLGAEYFNKTEFSQKLIIPTASLRKMKIIEIEKETNQKIKFIRITQE
jgi:regulatory protein YycI of two-component signal transduction system YycFG